MSISAPVPAQWRKQEYKDSEEKEAWTAAWAWIDLITPTPVTKGKEQKRDLPVAYIYSVYWKNHLKWLDSWTPSSEHEHVNLLGFSLLLFCQTW